MSGPGPGDAPELPVARAIHDAAYRLIVQRPGTARGPDGHRQSGSGPSGLPRPPPRLASRLYVGRGGGGLDAAADRPTDRGGAPPRDHAVCVRANGHADADPAGANWSASRGGSRARRGCTPSRRSASCWRSCASSPTQSSVDLYALAASTSTAGGEDLTAIVNMARRRNRSVWAILDELERQPGILRVSTGDSRRSARLVATCARYAARPTKARRASCCTASCATAGILARLVATDTPAAEEALQNVARFFEIIRPSRRLLADDRAMFVAGHLATLIEAGDDPATRRARSRRGRGRGADRPQGEGPRVPGRVPARPGRRSVPGQRPRRTAGPAGRARPGEPPASEAPSPRNAACATWR